MLDVQPVTLEAEHLRLVPLAGPRGWPAKRGSRWRALEPALHQRPQTGRDPGLCRESPAGQAEGHRLPFAVLDAHNGKVLGCTSYHDIVPVIDRLEIGWTWYARACSAPP